MVLQNLMVVWTAVCVTVSMKVDKVLMISRRFRPQHVPVPRVHDRDVHSRIGITHTRHRRGGLAGYHCGTPHVPPRSARVPEPENKAPQQQDHVQDAPCRGHGGCAGAAVSCIRRQPHHAHARQDARYGFLHS